MVFAFSRRSLGGTRSVFVKTGIRVKACFLSFPICVGLSVMYVMFRFTCWISSLIRSVVLERSRVMIPMFSKSKGSKEIRKDSRISRGRRVSPIVSARSRGMWRLLERAILEAMVTKGAWPMGCSLLVRSLKSVVFPVE